MSTALKGVYQRIYRCVARIPAGRVATYGQIAQLVDASGARQVGYALSATPPDIDIPWQRVINARGEISTRANGDPDSEQQRLLVAEGVMPDQRGRIDLERYRWQPDEEGDWEDEAFWRDQPGVG